MCPRPSAGALKRIGRPSVDGDASQGSMDVGRGNYLRWGGAPDHTDTQTDRRSFPPSNVSIDTGRSGRGQQPQGAVLKEPIIAEAIGVGCAAQRSPPLAPLLPFIYIENRTLHPARRDMYGERTDRTAPLKTIYERCLTFLSLTHTQCAYCTHIIVEIVLLKSCVRALSQE